MLHPFVNIFRGKVEEKKGIESVKVLYDEKNLSPECYKLLLMSELEDKFHVTGS